MMLEVFSILFSVFVFILILTIIVFVHELGHYYFAKKFGVKVLEFGLGLPPRLWGKRIGETLYSINWLPLGGFVSMKGEQYNEEEYQNRDQDSFLNKKPWQKAVILLAGVTMNVIFGILAFQLYLANNNYVSNEFLQLSSKEFNFGQTIFSPNVIGGFSENSPAQNAGLKVDDRIISLQQGNDKVDPQNIDELRDFLSDKSNQEVLVTIFDTNENNIKQVNVTPLDIDGQGSLGVYLADVAAIDYNQNKLMAGLLHSINMTDFTFSTLGNLTKQSIEEQNIEPVASSVSGPLGVLGVVNVILKFEGKEALNSLLNLFGLISISLAVMNLLPIPALDGGRLVFTIYEQITGKLPNPTLEANLVKWSFVFLLFLMIIVTIKDILILPQFF